MPTRRHQTLPSPDLPVPWPWGICPPCSLAAWAASARASTAQAGLRCGTSTDRLP